MNFHDSDDISGSGSQNINSPSGQASTTPQSTAFSKSKFNQLSFKLEPDSKSTAYIFSAGLFTRTLLPIDLSKEREVLIQCTM